MPPRKYAMVNKPDFTMLSDEEIRCAKAFAQKLVYAYDRQVDMLSSFDKLWKDLNREVSARKLGTLPHVDVTGAIVTAPIPAPTLQVRKAKTLPLMSLRKR